MLQNYINYKSEEEISSHLAPNFAEKQITIHILMKGKREVSIRSDTFLMCNKPHRKAFLLFSFGAPIYPKTSFGIDQKFTLIFTALDKDCKQFNFIGGKIYPRILVVADVQRNNQDVYQLTFD